ncbi:hypothetical protein HWV62_40304 [Athelia sp. TMB]|nr:hypothetical protein HWV62_40304 [Athelia sp. TMB]
MRVPLLRVCLVAISLLSSTHALHESEAGIVDWHKSLIGVPLTGSLATAPCFHRATKEDGWTTSLIISATGSNVLGALNAEDGGVAWRHVFEAYDPIAVFKKRQNTVAALSGPGGSTLRTFDVVSGDLLLEKRMHAPEQGTLYEPESLGTSIAFVPGSDNLLVLTSGHTLASVDGKTGETLWKWSSEDQGSLIIYSRIIYTPTAIYLVGIAKSTVSFTLHVTTLSPTDGTLIASQNIYSALPSGSPASSFLLLTNAKSAQVPHVLWLDTNNGLSTFNLTPDLKGAVGSWKGVKYTELIDVGLAEEHGLFVTVVEDGQSRAIRFGDGGDKGFEVVYSFPDSITSPSRSPSIYSGGFDKDGNPYIARVFWWHTFKGGYIQTLATNTAICIGKIFAFDTNTHGIMTHVTHDAGPMGDQFATRFVVSTSTGGMQLFRTTGGTKTALDWTREEGLSNVKIAEYVEIPELQVIEGGAGDVEPFADRLVRQIVEAKDFPRYAMNFAKRFATGSYASVSESVHASPSDGPLSRDAFGFRQVIVAATSYGKVYGIDSSNGEILWSRVLGLGWAAEVGGTIIPVKLYNTRTVADVGEDGEAGTPQVVLVTQRRAQNTLVDTVLFHIDAMTGEDSRKQSPTADLLQGFDIISGPVVEAFFLQNTTRTVVLFDEFMQVYWYPENAENKADFEAAAPSLHFQVRTGGPGNRQLMGHSVMWNPELSNRFVGYPTWAFALPAHEEIQSVISSKRGPVASIGKVLGNRTTLYKYLNPHLVAVTTASPASHPPTCAIYVGDAVKGTVVYHAVLPASGGLCDVQATLSDNWLVYHYFDEDLGGKSKGYRAVSVEFYEGAHADDKIKTSDMSSFSNQTTQVTVYDRAYVSQYGISAITTTSTKFGVTAKDVIFATKDGKVQSLPRRIFDPRRPSRKPTAEEVEEQLVQYEPVLPNPAQRILSHKYEVANVRKIVTAPALLESTSLVFAYGLDLFHTRIAPSGTFDVLSENFNKAQLVMTIIGLAGAIIVTKPMVARKRLHHSPIMSYSVARFNVDRSSDSDPTEKDELDVMARSSPAPAAPATSGRVLRARRSMGPLNTTPLKPKKRERRLSDSTVENHEGVLEKRRKMDDKKATTVVMNAKRVSLDSARRRWLHKHRELFLPMLPSATFFEHVEKGLKTSNDDTPYIPLHELDEQPKLIKNGTMKDYQLHGLSYLVWMYNNGMGCILGDEMGLGTQDPHLIICPLSVLSSWLGESARWVPSLKTLRFHGEASERARIKDKIRAGNESFDLCITTYEVLTGTPVQNNLVELWGLLHWLYPTVFTLASERLFKESFDLSRGSYSLPFLKAAQNLLATIMLRRTKANVEFSVPTREELTVFIPMTEAQRFWTYRLLTRMDTMDLKEIFTTKLEDNPMDQGRKEVMSHLATQMKRSNSGEANQYKKLMNLLMQLRKVCDHPYLLKDSMPEPYNLGEHIIASSSKMIAIDKLLADILPTGDRVLIFSQWTSMLDMLEDFLAYRNIPYARLDGGTTRPRRTLDIKLFQQEQSPYKVFLISTKAGGLGINLTKANHVIMCDSDWNPQNDLQAIARAHRIGQTKTVKVYRLICRGSVEDQMLSRIYKKMFLSFKVMGGSDNPTNSDNSQLGRSEVMDILRKGTSALSRADDGMELSAFLNAPIAKVLDHSRSLDNIRDAKMKNELSAQGLDVKVEIDEKLLLDADAEERKLLSGVEQVQSRLFEGKVISRQNNKEIADEWKDLQKRARTDRLVIIDGIAVIADHVASVREYVRWVE